MAAFGLPRLVTWYHTPIRSIRKGLAMPIDLKTPPHRQPTLLNVETRPQIGLPRQLSNIEI
jgi:hypothetical protein